MLKIFSKAVTAKNHATLEVFAAFTRLPVEPRIEPAEAALIVKENMLAHFQVVSAGQDGYLDL